jgi:hypothetical protein
VVTGSTGIDASAVSIAADDSAVGMTKASVNHVAETAESVLAERFTISPSGAANGSPRVIRRT